MASRGSPAGSLTSIPPHDQPAHAGLPACASIKRKSDMTANTPEGAHVRGLDLNVEQRPIAELKPLGRKARHHNAKQLAAIKASVEQFGFVNPVLIDHAGRIIAGNARVEAAKALGMATVPCIVIDHLSPEEQRAYVLADNRLAELASWNKEALQLELKELSELELDFKLDITGFSLAEIDAICFDIGGADAAADNVPDVQPTFVSQVGDLWRL